MPRLFRVVIDTNTLLRGLASASSAAARVRRAAEQRMIIPLLSKPVLDEYRSVLADAELVERFPGLTPKLVELSIRRLRFVGEYVRSPNARFDFPRDRRDAKFIELAISLNATQILSSDRDLLSLPGGQGEASRRFRQRLPGADVMDTGTFMRQFGEAIGPAR